MPTQLALGMPQRPMENARLLGELRNAEHRELYLAGLRLAASEERSI